MLRSAITLKTIHGDSHILMITDEKRLIKCVTLRYGRTIATDYKWQTYRGDLDVICQNSQNKFLFTTRGNHSLSSSCIRDRIVLCDFETNENEMGVIDGQDMSVCGYDDMLLRTVYQRVPGTSRWSKMLLLGDYKNILKSMIEPPELTHLPCIYLPSQSGEIHKLIYFYTIPSSESSVKDIAVLPLDPNDDSLDYSVVQCSPDPRHGYPKGKLLNGSNRKRFHQNLFVKNGVFYCLDVKRNHLAVAVWILRLDNLNPTWERFGFVNQVQLASTRPFKLITNDEGEILIIESDDKWKHTSDSSNIRVILCGRLKVSSLKHLAAQLVIESNPFLLSMNEKEQRFNGIPFGCIPSCPWMKNFSKPMSTED